MAFSTQKNFVKSFLIRVCVIFATSELLCAITYWTLSLKYEKISHLRRHIDFGPNGKCTHAHFGELQRYDVVSASVCRLMGVIDVMRVFE